MRATGSSTTIVHRVCDRKSYEDRKQFLRAVDVWNALVGSDVAQATLSGLLPATPAEPPKKREPRSGYKGWLPTEAPASLREDFASFVQGKRHGVDDGLDDEPLGEDSEESKLNFSDNSAKAYGYAVGWVYRTLICADLIGADDVPRPTGRFLTRLAIPVRPSRRL